MANHCLLALIFGVLNALLRPLLTLLTCPLNILTLGLGTLIINALLFYLTGRIGLQFAGGSPVDGFWSAFLGALVVSIVSIGLSGIQEAMTADVRDSSILKALEPILTHT